MCIQINSSTHYNLLIHVCIRTYKYTAHTVHTHTHTPYTHTHRTHTHTVRTATHTHRTHKHARARTHTHLHYTLSHTTHTWLLHNEINLCMWLTQGLLIQASWMFWMEDNPIVWMVTPLQRVEQLPS